MNLTKEREECPITFDNLLLKTSKTLLVFGHVLYIQGGFVVLALVKFLSTVNYISALSLPGDFTKLHIKNYSHPCIVIVVQVF